MKLLIHDLDIKNFKTNFPKINDEITVIGEHNKIRNCIGCFGCWIKTPGKCVLKDGYEMMGELMSASDEVIVISKCCYGTYSPFVKNIFDRSISFLLPYFRKLNKETHHKPRYKNKFKLSVYFYGSDITEEEQNTAIGMVKANGINFNVSEHSVRFFNSVEQICKEVDLS